MQSPGEILDRIRAWETPFQERAYLFVLAALEYAQRRRVGRGHVGGADLARACRDLARDQFGLTAGLVWHHWGIRTTEDIGQIVFRLIDVGLLMKQDSDRLEDFESVFDFGDAFDERGLWQGVGHDGG